MAISDVKLKLTFSPNSEQTHFYFDTPENPNPSGKGVRIEWSDDNSKAPYTIKYSIDGGSTLEATPIATGVNETYYEWHLTKSEFDIIFANGDVNSDVLIMVFDDDANPNYDNSATYNFCKQTFSSILPNDTTTTNTPISYYDAFNILWDQLYATEMQLVDIILDYGGTKYTIYKDIPYTLFNAPWNISLYTLPLAPPNNLPIPKAGTAPSYNSTCTVTVKGASGTNHESNSITSTEFNITADKTNVTSSINTDVGSSRINVFKRIALEKGALVDEAVAIGQLEAGRGVKITQRDFDGKRVGHDGVSYSFQGDPDTGAPAPDSVDYKKSYNIVISVDESTLTMRQPRMLQGIFTPTTPVVGWVAGADKYGSMFYYDIKHNWALGDNTDPNYIAGQNIGSYNIQIKDITDDDAYDPSLPSQGTSVQTEPIDEDTIRCYVVKKGGAYQPTLAKDKVSDNLMSDYLFEYVLIERI